MYTVVIKKIRKNPKLKTKVVTSKTRTVKTKKKVKTTKHRNKKRSKYFKHRTRENIYTDDKNITDDFGENKVLINSYFYKTHIQWNNLPLGLKILDNYDKFKVKLEEYLWESILECDEQVQQNQELIL